MQTLNGARTHIWRHRSRQANTDQHVPHSHTSRLRLQANSQGPVSHILDNVDFFRWVQTEPQAKNRSHYSLIGTGPAKHHHSLIHVHQKRGHNEPSHQLFDQRSQTHTSSHSCTCVRHCTGCADETLALSRVVENGVCLQRYTCVAMRCQ